MSGTKRHVNTENIVRISNAIQHAHKSRYQRALFSSKRGPGTFSAASRWYKKADLMMTAGRGEADRRSSQERERPRQLYSEDS
jgi:hypothetical protein